MSNSRDNTNERFISYGDYITLTGLFSEMLISAENMERIS